VTDFTCAPELAAVFILERALDVAIQALLAEHPTLVDDFPRPSDRGTVVSFASKLCWRAASLREAALAYRRAVHDAAAPDQTDSDADLPF
jgi:hypothetical protein